MLELVDIHLLPGLIWANCWAVGEEELGHSPTAALISSDPDIKRMALEAADRVHINQVYAYPDGATKQQWDAFIVDYRIRQILWTRDNPGKLTGGTQHQPSAGAATPARYEIGCARHMRGWQWQCPNDTFDLAVGGTGCSDGSHNPNSVYPSDEAKAKAQAKLDYPNASSDSAVPFLWFAALTCT
jgi:hypothetical protein